MFSKKIILKHSFLSSTIFYFKRLVSPGIVVFWKKHALQELIIRACKNERNKLR